MFATFEVGVTSQFVSKKGWLKHSQRCWQPLPSPLSDAPDPCDSCPAGLPKSSEQAYIEFESIEAIVKTASRTKFFIEFYSTCLEGESAALQEPLATAKHIGIKRVSLLYWPPADTRTPDPAPFPHQEVSRTC